MPFRASHSAGRASLITTLTNFVSTRSGILLDSQFGTVFETGQRCTSWTPRTGGSAFTAASASTARPTLTNGNMVFDGVANVMKGSTGFFAGTLGWTCVVVGKATGGGTESYLVNAGDASNYLGIYCRNTPVFGGVIVGAGPKVNEYQSYKDSSGWGIYAGRATYANGINAVAPQTLNGTTLFGTLLGGSQSVATVTIPSTPVALGGVNASAGTFAAMTARFIVMFQTALSDADLTTLTTLLMQVSTSRKYQIKNAPYTDTVVPNATNPNYDVVSEFARLICSTDADEIQLLTTAVTSTPQYTIGWRLNGGARTVVDVGTIAYPLLSLGSPGTTKTVEIEVGPQSFNITQPNAGNYPTEAWVPPGRSLSFVPQSAPTRRLVAVGDSIFTGQAATQYQASGCAILTRNTYPGQVTYLSAGVYSLFELSTQKYANVTTLANAINALADGTGTNELLLQVSTNDFGLSQWSSVANFQTAYQNLLTLVGPSFSKVWIQTAGQRTDIPSNSFGQLISQYRTAVSGAAVATGIGTVIDGTTLYTLTGSSDNLHPAASEQINYAANLKTAMGF